MFESMSLNQMSWPRSPLRDGDRGGPNNFYVSFLTGEVKPRKSL